MGSGPLDIDFWILAGCVDLMKGNERALAEVDLKIRRARLEGSENGLSFPLTHLGIK